MAPEDAVGRASDQRFAHIEQQATVCLLADRARFRKRLRRLYRRAEAAGEETDAGLDSALQRLTADIARSCQIVDGRRAIEGHISFARDLPLSAHVGAIEKLLARHQLVIVSGDTGSGKSTQLPKICLRLGRGIEARIGHHTATTPRRPDHRAAHQRRDAHSCR